MAKPFTKMGSFLTDLLEKRGLTQVAFGEAIGISRQNVNAWIKGEQLPPAHRMSAIAAALGTTVRDLLSHVPANRQPKYRGVFESAVRHNELYEYGQNVSAIDQVKAKRVPLLGFTEGTHPGLCTFDANNPPPTDEYVDAPPGGDGKQFYALRVKGSSMSPRYVAGDIVYFCPGVEVHSGEEAIVVLEDGQCMLKRVKISDDSIMLISVQDDPVVVPRSKVRCMHRLMWVKR